jgi:hypothetical protein
MTIEFPSIAIPASIRAERQRQIDSEGWTPAHDDQHDGRELMAAAMCYFRNAKGEMVLTSCREVNGQGRHVVARVPMGWPWDSQWWKPKGKRRDLVRAGALMLAEAERLRRRDPACALNHVADKLRRVCQALNGLSA